MFNSNFLKMDFNKKMIHQSYFLFTNLLSLTILIPNWSACSSSPSVNDSLSEDLLSEEFEILLQDEDVLTQEPAELTEEKLDKEEIIEDINNDEETILCDGCSNCIEDSSIPFACKFLGSGCECGQALSCDYKCNCGDGHVPFEDDPGGSWAFYKIYIPVDSTENNLSISIEDCWQSSNPALMVTRNRIPSTSEFQSYIDSETEISDPSNGIWVSGIGPVGNIHVRITDISACDRYYLLLHNEWTREEGVYTYECNHGLVSGCYANASCGWFKLYYSLN